MPANPDFPRTHKTSLTGWTPAAAEALERIYRHATAQGVNLNVPNGFGQPRPGFCATLIHAVELADKVIAEAGTPTPVPAPLRDSDRLRDAMRKAGVRTFAAVDRAAGVAKGTTRLVLTGACSLAGAGGGALSRWVEGVEAGT